MSLPPSPEIPEDIPQDDEPYSRFDFIEPGDKTALVCLDQPAQQRYAVEQLDELGYKLHTGMFLDDSLLKMRAHAYDVVLASENFSSCTLHDHPVLDSAADVSPGQRRKQLYVLIAKNLRTGDELEAFALSVDVIVAEEDMVNLKPILRRAVNNSTEFYQPFHTSLDSVLAADHRLRHGLGGT